MILKKELIGKNILQINFLKIIILKIKQIINLKINVKKDYEEIIIYNRNKEIEEKNINIFIENKETEIKNKINNLKKGIYNIIIKINQKITNCKKMFYCCENILEIDFSNFDTKNVIDMSSMFCNCSSLKI